MHRISTILSALFLTFATTTSAKEIGRYLSPDGSFELAVEVPPRADGKDLGIELNKLQSLFVRVVARDPARPRSFTNLTFNARMPAHDHGMVTKPQVTTVATNEFKVEGVKLHMAGQWELSFVVGTGAQSATITAPFEVGMAGKA